MSTVFSKNKEKRSRTSSSEGTNSFVKNVTSRMSGLLPATITKWFSSPSSSANGSAPTADSDSSTEDEAPESPAAAPPPVKRMRLASPATHGYTHYKSTDVPHVASNTDTLEICSPYEPAPARPVRMNLRRDVVSTPVRHAPAHWPDDADKSDKDSSMFKSSHSVSALGAGPSSGLKRKSLFDSPSNNEASKLACAKTAKNAQRDPSQPCFKPSLLGSPFYPGLTTYGGASASYINRPNIKQRKNAIVNETNSTDNASMSSSAKKIMELLEEYSSPLNEAKRIAQYIRPSQPYSLNTSLNSSTSEFNRVNLYKRPELQVPSIASILRLKRRSRLADATTAARQLIASHSSTADYPPPDPRDQPEWDSSKLTTKVKSRLTRPKRGESLEAEAPPAPQFTAALHIAPDNLPRFSLGAPLAAGTPLAPKPSTAHIVTETRTRQVTETKTTTTKVTNTIRKPEVNTNYKFSSPVTISNESNQKTTIPKFTFGSPDRSVDKKINEKSDSVSCVVGPKENSVPLPKNKSKDWECSACWVRNKPDVDTCVSCQSKKTTTTDDGKNVAKCSVCKFAAAQKNSEKCLNCEKVTINSFSKPIATKDASTKWKCGDCWVNNDESAASCACCGGKRPEQAAAPSPAAAPSSAAAPSPAAAPSQAVADEWKCGDCWIKNKAAAESCAACGGARPGAPADPFKNIVKEQTDKWECSNCLVRNESNRTKCACCEIDRSGAPKEPQKNTFNFGINSTFKFGIDPKLQNSAPKETKQDATQPVVSETNNNILPKAPAFTFGTPANKIASHSEVAQKVEEKIESSPKIKFSFGIPEAVSSAPATEGAPTVPSMFGGSKPPASDTLAGEKEKPQEVPKVDLTVPKSQESPKPTTFMFSTLKPNTLNSISLEKPSVPVTSTPSKAAPAVSFAAPPAPVTTAAAFAAPAPAPANNFPVTNFKLLPKYDQNPSVTIFQKSEPSAPAPAPAVPATTATIAATFNLPQTTVPNATFPGIQKNDSTPSVSLFQKNEPSTLAPATTAGLGIAFNMQQTVPSTSTSLFKNSAPTTTFSMFQKNDSKPSASVFQKSEPTSSAPAPAPAASLFSFGSNPSAAAPQPDKPNFNFTFNKTDSNLFMTPFGGQQDGSNAVKFPMTTASTLTSGGVLGANGPATIKLPNSTSTENSLGGAGGGLFGAPAQESGMWSANNNASNNLFVTNASNTQPKTAAFTFGSTTTFSGAQPAAPVVFGAPSAGAAPGGLFAAPSQPALFPSAAPAAPMFAPAAAPAFAPSAPVPSFEAPSMTPAPAPAFNFGAPQSSGLFGFGQQQQGGAAGAAGGMYNFGAPQFSMGSPGAAAGARRVRKAVRRTTPR